MNHIEKIIELHSTISNAPNIKHRVSERIDSPEFLHNIFTQGKLEGFMSKHEFNNIAQDFKSKILSAIQEKSNAAELELSKFEIKKINQP